MLPRTAAMARIGGPTLSGLHWLWRATCDAQTSGSKERTATARDPPIAAAGRSVLCLCAVRARAGPASLAIARAAPGRPIEEPNRGHCRVNAARAAASSLTTSSPCPGRGTRSAWPGLRSVWYACRRIRISHDLGTRSELSPATPGPLRCGACNCTMRGCVPAPLPGNLTRAGLRHRATAFVEEWEATCKFFYAVVSRWRPFPGAGRQSGRPEAARPGRSARAPRGVRFGRGAGPWLRVCLAMDGRRREGRHHATLPAALYRLLSADTGS